MASIGAGLAALINGDSAMKTLGVSVNNAAQLASTESFSGNAIVPSGASVAQGSGTDGSSNTATNPAQVNVQGGTGASLTFDANGNMLTDQNGNSYVWDACDRLIKITYPGSNNFSTFVYDGFGRNVSIVETTAGSVTSTKQFIWCGARREQRDSSSSVTAQFFTTGETIGGTKYFYAVDHLGSNVTSPPFAQFGEIDPRGFNPLSQLASIREMTNTSSAIADERGYDPFGRTTQLQGSLASDFQYAGYYVHARSGMSLTNARSYNSNLGIWISREPGEEGEQEECILLCWEQPNWIYRRRGSSQRRTVPRYTQQAGCTEVLHSM